MRVAIHSHQLDPPRDVAAFVRKHVVASLRRLHDSPASDLVVYVEDAKPGKGGVDQSCKMTYRIPGARTLRVESTTEDLHAALLECARRLRRLVQREVQKKRSPSRAPEHRPLGRTWRKVAARGVTLDGGPAAL